MIILGLNAYHADSSAAIFKDGILIAATEEERFRRIKHWAGFPSEAVKFCLREAGVTLEQVKHICIGRDPKAKFWKKVQFV
jgi:carbamoyltransferase